MLAIKEMRLMRFLVLESIEISAETDRTIFQPCAIGSSWQPGTGATEHLFPIASW
jgi:hypothetical protein